MRERCSSCGFDLKAADSGDGPAVFIILVVGFLVGFAALYTEMAYRPPIWLHLAIWLPLATILCLLLLRPFKATLVALQFHHRASQHVSDEF